MYSVYVFAISAVEGILIAAQIVLVLNILFNCHASIDVVTINGRNWAIVKVWCTCGHTLLASFARNEGHTLS